VILTACLGMPRSTNTYSWSNVLKNFFLGKISFDEVENIALQVKEENLQCQLSRKIDIIPSNDFFYFDNVLENTLLT
jgi:5-methyltetrahydropteroyltriglutamate--homocysteine methyltransferase